MRAHEHLIQKLRTAPDRTFLVAPVVRWFPHANHRTPISDEHTAAIHGGQSIGKVGKYLGTSNACPCTITNYWVRC